MNKNRMLILSLLALVLSVFAAFIGYRLLQNRLVPPSNMTRIVVAAEKLPLGARLTAQDLRLVSWPQSSPLEGSFASPDELVGRGVVVALGPNEPVLESKLAPKQAGAGLGLAIPEGMRAVSVKVNDVIGVAGFVGPGTRVDVIVVGSPEAENQTDTSKVVLENVQVLAAGQNVEQDINGKPQTVPVVTLLVSPEDSQKLALASVDGRIQLALRNPLDLEYRNPVAVRKEELYTATTSPSAQQVPHNEIAPLAQTTKPMVARSPRRSAAPAPRAVAAPEASPPVAHIVVVEVIRGDKREKTSFAIEQK